MNPPPTFAIALTGSERELLLRAVRDQAELEDDPRLHDVASMLENAVDQHALASLVEEAS